MGILPKLKRETKSHDDFIPANIDWSDLRLPRTSYIYSNDVKRGLRSNVFMSPVMWVMRTSTEADARLQAKRQGMWQWVEDSEIEQLLNEPNPFYGGDEMFKGLTLSYQMDGNAYIKTTRNVFGSIIQLDYIPHWLIRPETLEGSNDLITHYEYTPGGQRFLLAPRDVIHIRFGLDPRDVRIGLSPLKALMREIFTDDEAANFSATILRNMGVPGLLVSPKEGARQPTEAEVKETKEFFATSFNRDRRGEPLVMGAPTDVKQFGFDPNQLTLANLRDIAEERVCLHPDTDIITKRGVLPITAVRPGDEVVTHRGRWRQVLGISETPAYEPMVRVQADGLTPLRITTNHRVLAATYGPDRSYRLEYRGIDWVQAGKLTPRKLGSRRNGHWMTIPVLSNVEVFTDLDLLPHVEGERFPLSEEAGVLVHPSPRVQTITARPALDQAFGRLLGFYLAEGSSGDNRVYWYFGETEVEYQETVQRDLVEVFRCRSFVIPIPQHHVRAVVVQSAMLAQLFALGRAPTKRLPTWAWDGGDEFRRAVLHAWVCGDGSVNDRGQVRVTTMSRDLAWQMRLLAISCGYAASIRVSAPRESIIDGRTVKHSGPIYVVSWSSPSVLRQRWYRIETGEYGSFWTGAVREVVPFPYTGSVYNLQVDEDQSYLTTGGMVHNCAALGIPAAIIGFGAGLQQTKVGATMRELRRLAWAACINPMHNSFGKQIGRQLIPEFRSQTRRFRIRFDTREVSAFSEEETEKAARIGTLVEKGIMRVDKAQEIMGLEVDESQAIYLRSTNTLAVRAGEEPAVELVPDDGSAGESDESVLQAAGRVINRMKTAVNGRGD